MRYSVVVSPGPFPDIRTAAFAEEAIDWWDDRQAPAQNACTLCFAATELETFLPGKVTLRKPGEPVPEEDTVIYLETGAPELPPEGFRITCRGNTLRLTGGDRVGTLYAAYGCLERLGCRFIEPGEPDRTAPCAPGDFEITEAPDFLTRGTMSTFINASEEFLLWMARNRFNSGFFRKANHHFALRKKLGIATVVGGHQMFYLFCDTTQEYPYCHSLYGSEGKPADPWPVSPLCRKPGGERLTYGEAHPEWYALVDGQRRMKRDRQRFLQAGNAPGDNMCTSNEDAMEELCTRILEALIDGIWKYADHVHIWPLDNGIWCQCDRCRALGNYSTRILLLAYRVDKAIKEAYRQGRLKRKILLICPAYHETLPVPDRPLPEDFDYGSIITVFYPIERCFSHRLDDPICTETNALLMERLLPWCRKENYRGQLVIGEYYNVSSFAAMPFVLQTRILEEIPMYYRLGVRHFHYMHITARDWGFIAVNNYLHGKLLWNVRTRSGELIRDYFTARYGEYAERMKDLYARLEKATANCKYYKHYQFVDGKIIRLFGQLSSEEPQTEESLFPLKHMRLRSRADDPQAGPSLLETLEGMAGVLERLEALLREAPEHRNLLRDAGRLRFGTAVTEFLYLMCLGAIGEADGAQRERLHTLAALLEQDTGSMAGYDFGDDFRNALTATWVAKTYAKKYAPEKSGIQNGVAL